MIGAGGMSTQTEELGEFNPRKNLLLASLGPEDYGNLMQGATLVPLKFRKRLYDQDSAIDVVYFPITCVVSLLVSIDDKPAIEMATIGREGVVGASEVTEMQGALGLSTVLLPGTAMRINPDAFRNLSPKGRALMHRHFFALTKQILYGAACNRLHSIEKRCARWLLMTHDRAGENEFPITQEFLSHMLGVRRATVNSAIGALKNAGFIRSVRGRIRIIDRGGLESACCPCYHAIVRAYDGILGVPA
jgi:CRP-like cAMP-binding protein